jgi:hypothetical protein
MRDFLAFDKPLGLLFLVVHERMLPSRESHAVRYLALTLASLILTGCALPGPALKQAYEHYDECMAELPGKSFSEIAACGRQRRQAQCTSSNTCSSNGSSFVSYVDSLGSSVERKEMTDNEAKRRYIEFRTSAINTQLNRAALQAAQAPTTCVTSGAFANCF